MDEVEVDVEQRRLVVRLADEVRLPDAVEERPSHPRIVPTRLSVEPGEQADALRSRRGRARPHRPRPQPRAARAPAPARARAAPAPRALERVGGIQAQYAPSSYIGLWSRLDGFALGDLTRALERRRAVQGTLLRSTIHLVSAGDYWAFALGSKAARQEGWLRFDRKRLSRSTMEAAAKEVRAALAGRVAHRDELLELARRRDPERPTHLWNGLAAWVDLVRAPPSGTWERRRADLYALAEEWVGPPATTPAEGAELLLRRYLAAFGPARLADAANWAGVAVADLEPAAERLRTEDVPGRGGPRAARPPARSASRRRRAGTGALPPDLGRHAARPRSPHSDPARGLPPARLRHEDPAVHADVPGGRRSRGQVEDRAEQEEGNPGPRAVRASAAARRGGQLEDEAAASCASIEPDAESHSVR